jgi:hypothetical protein
MRTTRFRVWFQRSVSPTDLERAVWTGVSLVQRPRISGFDAVDVTVVGDGSELRKLVGERQDVFAALLELRPGDE